MARQRKTQRVVFLATPDEVAELEKFRERYRLENISELLRYAIGKLRERPLADTALGRGAIANATYLCKALARIRATSEAGEVIEEGELDNVEHNGEMLRICVGGLLETI